MKAMRPSSEILKNAMMMKMMSITTAIAIPKACDVLLNALNAHMAAATPIARRNNWMIDKLIGPIWKVNQARSHFLIFLG
jgi:hypothetical protein